jgi:Meckel syndrome type 1 protein
MPTYKHPCPHCGAFIARDVTACPACGRPDPFAPARCPNCRATVETAWVACPKCGTKLAPATPSAAPRPAATPGATPGLAPGQAPEARVCTGCGAPLPAGARFCRECGTLAG